MGEKPQVRVEPSQKRVRGYIAGDLVFDTTNAFLVWEVPYYPSYYIPERDVVVDLLANGRTKDSKTAGSAELFDLKVSTTLREDAGWRDPRSPIEELRDAIRFDWDAIDEWLEEDEPVYVHARSPYTRIDILQSSRHVEVVVDGVKVAESSNPMILFETGLPPRFYLPMSHVRMDMLEPSDRQTQCPYKGTATYWSLRVGEKTYDDFVWTYRTPLPESQKIAGLLAFYNEKVDLYMDGELQNRPNTKFS